MNLSLFGKYYLLEYVLYSIVIIQQLNHRLSSNVVWGETSLIDRYVEPVNRYPPCLANLNPL